MQTQFTKRSYLWAMGAAAGLLLGEPLAVANTPDAAAVRAPTAEVLARFPTMTGFQLSPDGKHLLAIESQGDTRTIVVWPSSNLSAKPTVIGAKSMQIRSASFLKNDMLQVVMTQPFDLRTDQVTKTFINKLLFTDLEGNKWIEPMASADIARSESARLRSALANPTVLNRLPNDPDHVVVLSDSRGDGGDVYRYNVRTGSATRLLRLGEQDAGVLVNASGQVWAKTRGGSDAQGVYIATDFRSAKGDWEEHFRSYVKDRDVVSPVAQGAKPNVAIIRSSVDREFSALYEYDINERKKTALLFEHKFFDAVSVRSFSSNESVGEDGFDGFVYEGLSEGDDHWEAPEIDAVVRGVAQALGLKEVVQELRQTRGDARALIRRFDPATVRIVQRVGKDKPVYLLRVSGPTYPTEHYLLAEGRLQLLAKERPEIDRRALGTSSFIYYQSRDGLNVPAFLHRPNEALCGPGPHAAVVHPHGGPWARDRFDYDTSGWVPLMVSQCHVVLQPQFRGSAGWGRTLWFEGDREWGQKMQDDKDDGARWLVTQKMADPSRVAMFGYSYGGYAAFAAAVRPNDLYKCAISGAGVSDIERIWASFFTNPFFRQRQEPTVRGMSPLQFADKIKIPIMVYHGDRDQTVPVVQSELFVNKAKGSGQPVDYHLLKDYAHGPAWRRQTIAHQLSLIGDYFRRGCGGKGL